MRGTVRWLRFCLLLSYCYMHLCRHHRSLSHHSIMSHCNYVDFFAGLVRGYRGYSCVLCRLALSRSPHVVFLVEWLWLFNMAHRTRVIPLGVTDVCWLKRYELWKHECIIQWVRSRNPSMDALVLAKYLRNHLVC